MKYVIELGLSFIILAIVANKLPSIIRKAQKEQFILMKETSASNWGRAWLPQNE